MTFLELCKRVHLILRIGEETPGTQPASVTTARGVLAEIVSSVAASYDDILRSNPAWLFLHEAQGQLTLPEGGISLARSAQIAQIPDLAKLTPYVGADYAYLLLQPPQGSSDVDSSEQEVRYVNSQEWFGHFDVKPIPTGQPSFFTIDPQTEALIFDTAADREYTLRTGYRRVYPQLANNDDVPLIPEEHQLAIVWWAVARYYCVSRDKTSELRQKADIELKREMNNLRIYQLPSTVLG
jgi:hypothetical protein